MIVELTNKDIEINECKLLSVEEAEKCKKETLANNDWWWLCSPGFYLDSASDVDSDGSINALGNAVNYDSSCVRPALFCNLKSANSLKEGNSAEINNIEFVYLYDGIFLVKDFICKSAFRNDYEAEDANDYEKSDIKKIVDIWFKENFAGFNEVKEEYKIDTEESAKKLVEVLSAEQEEKESNSNILDKEEAIDFFKENYFNKEEPADLSKEYKFPYRNIEKDFIEKHCIDKYEPLTIYLCPICEENRVNNYFSVCQECKDAIIWAKKKMKEEKEID